MAINLAEELLLLAYDDSGRANAGTPALDYGLAGALLLELTLTRRLTVVDRKVVVSDARPAGDPVVDSALAQIAGDDRRRNPQDWVGRVSKGLRDRILDRLVEENVLRREKDKVLWIFPRTRYPSTTGGQPSEEAEVRRRLETAVAGDGPVDARTAALCALVRALHLEATAFPGRPRRQVRNRLKAIAKGNWPADVRAASEEVEAAVLIAVTAATVITTTAASS